MELSCRKRKKSATESSVNESLKKKVQRRLKKQTERVSGIHNVSVRRLIRIPL